MVSDNSLKKVIMKSIFKIAVLTLCILVTPWMSGPVGAARILSVSSVAAKSHWNFMSGILRALTDRGHTVISFSSFLDGDRTNYTEVDISKDMQVLFGMDTTEAIAAFGNFFDTSIEIYNINRDSCYSVYENKIIKEILSGKNGKFDVVITEPIVTECISSLAVRLGTPLIYVVTAPVLLPFAESKVFGHYPNPAVLSHMFGGAGAPKTFVQRFTSTGISVLTTVTLWLTDKFFIAYHGHPYDTYGTVKPSIVFTNTHHITDAGRPMSANVVPIAGIHLSKPKTLPKDILEFIDQSPNGVILFSFGSVATISTLPKNIKKIFIEALSQLPQRVLIKYEGKLENKPKNIMTLKWIPQRDILAHPKVKLFISHGGVSGMYETVDAGVPVLGFPLMYDQPRNIQLLVDAGMAISMDIFSMTTQTLTNAINEIINNKIYSKNAKLASEQFNDRPISSAELAVYWTEYAIRHKGAQHLRSHAYNLTWYQYLLLDVIGAVFIILLVIYYIVRKMLRAIHGRIFKSSSNTKSKNE